MTSISKKYNLFWFILSIIALATSGLYSVAVSMMRNPAIFNLFNYPDFFKVSLVIHVTLSINIWFILFAQFHLENSFGKFPIINYLHKYLAALSILLIIISGLIPGTNALTYNYIPMLNNLWFIVGIAIFFINFGVYTLIALVFLLKDWRLIIKNIDCHLKFFIILSAIISFLCLIYSGYNLTTLSDLEEVFWGFGHGLQFLFIEVALLCLVKNLTQYNNFISISDSSKILLPLSILKIINLLIMPFFYFFDNSHELFTLHMRYGMLIFLFPLSIIIIKKLLPIINKYWKHYAIISFILAIIISIYGGIIGYLILEINVTIPAHYHASLIAITIMIMGSIYGYLEYIDKKENLWIFTKSIKKVILIQLIIYGLGHMMHVSGLLMMGGYGALRKTPGDMSNVSRLGKYIFMSGSGLSIIGGIMFILIGAIIIYKIIKNHRSLSPVIN